MSRNRVTSNILPRDGSTGTPRYIGRERHIEAQRHVLLAYPVQNAASLFLRIIAEPRIYTIK